MTPHHSAPESPAELAAISAQDAPLKALNPFDGLFLRAEHLKAIQDYAQGVAWAAGRAGGAGVVHGCTAALPENTNKIHVTEGLAIAPSGQPLLVSSPISAPLPAPDSAAYMVVELVPDAVPTGTPENVFGLLCEDPCSGGGQFRPYWAQQVKIHFRDLTLTLPVYTGHQLRSAVASAFFENERRTRPSLLPTSERDPVKHAELDSSLWSSGTDPEAPGGVPVGLLVRVNSTWVLDVWAARRDRMDPPPQRGWARRTGRRPPNVFLAQVLQFQTQLTDLGIPAKIRGGVGGGLTLPKHFLDLPPAGYLPINPSSVLSVNDQVSQLFGPGVDLRFCSARADEIGLALERAQHLDRIRLSASTNNDPPQIDIIVPDATTSHHSASVAAHFAGGTLTRGKRTWEGLARLHSTPGAAVTLSFAAEDTGKDLDGLWADIYLSRSPFEMEPGESAIVRATLAAHHTQTHTQSRLGQVLQRIEFLRGSLECLEASLDPVTSLPTVEGSLTGELTLRLGNKWQELNVTATLRLSVARTTSSDNVLDIDVVDVTGPLTAAFRVQATQRTTGWSVSFDTGTTAQIFGGVGVVAQFNEIAPGNVLPSRHRWAAERGLASLDATSFPATAVSLLFNQGGATTTQTGYTTAHDWVFFTRRHLLNCGTPDAVEPDAFRLDLYVDEKAVSSAQPASPTTPTPPQPTRRYVAQLSWGRKSRLLSPDSQTVVDAWRQFHPGAVPVAAMVWPGNSITEDQTRTMVNQVMGRLMPGTTAPVTRMSGPSELTTTPGSSGSLVVTVASEGLAPRT